MKKKKRAKIASKGYVLFGGNNAESRKSQSTSSYVRNTVHAYGAMTIASNAMRVYSPYLICLKYAARGSKSTSS